MVRWVFALAMVMHGLGHVMGALAAWTRVPVGFRDRPWLLSASATVAGPAGRAWAVLWLAALVGFLLSAVGFLGRYEWWRPLATVSAVVSLVAIIPWWNAVPDGARYGGVLFDFVVLAVTLVPRGEHLVRAG